MVDTCAVSLQLDLPSPIADEVEQLQHNDPELLGWIISHGLIRRAVFEHLSQRQDLGYSDAEPARLTSQYSAV